MNDENREYYRDQFLMHYGKIGMKWGKRKVVKEQSRTKRNKRMCMCVCMCVS